MHRPPPKKLNRIQLTRFWQAFDAGKRRRTESGAARKGRWFHLTGAWKREPLAVTPSLLGTVRTFKNMSDMEHFLSLVKRINLSASKKPFVHVVFQPTQVLGVDWKNLRILERVYRAPNAFQVLDERSGSPRKSLYGRILANRLQGKGITVRDIGFLNAVNSAQLEFAEAFRWNIVFDSNESNFLVLDFDPKSKKVLMAIVDPGKSEHI